MKRPAIYALGVIAAGAAVLIAGFLAMPGRFHLESTASQGTGTVIRGLPFRREGDALDGTLRLYIGDHKRQTNIPFTRDLTIEWIHSDPPETFSVKAKGSTLMSWRIEGDAPLCISGQEHLVSDPYLR